MPRRNGSGAFHLESALSTIAGKNPPKADAKLVKAIHRAHPAMADEGQLYAVKLPNRDGVSVQYVAPQLDANGKPTVEDGGGKSWRSAWFSLTVNAYRRDGDGPAPVIALVNAISGEPLVRYNGAAYLVVSATMLADAR